MEQPELVMKFLTVLGAPLKVGGSNTVLGEGSYGRFPHSSEISVSGFPSSLWGVRLNGLNRDMFKPFRSHRRLLG